MITPASDRFATLKFQYPFRKYQRMIIELIGQSWQQDRQHHLVAPPGSGKTIVGLELIRQFGRPAVVFCPTTTIQKQWQEKVGLFTEDDAWLKANVTTDARNVKPITILTYQILSTPGENLAFVEQIAVEQWQEDLVKSGQVGL